MHILNSKKGEFLLNGSLGVLLGAFILAIFISVISIGINTFQLSAIASDVVRQIEIRGHTGGAEEFIDNDSITMTIQNEEGYDLHDKKIQFGEAFVVELRKAGGIELGGFIDIPMDIHSSVKGRSERYWK